MNPLSRTTELNKIKATPSDDELNTANEEYKSKVLHHTLEF
jgi:hypothetical protein